MHLTIDQERMPAVSAEPIFIAQTDGKNTPEEKQAWFQLQADEAKSKGATFCRFSYDSEQEDRCLVEGWSEQPDDQGPLRWQAKADA